MSAFNLPHVGGEQGEHRKRPDRNPLNPDIRGGNSVHLIASIKPGFCDCPQGFDIVPVKLGLTSWTEGFVTELGPPLKDASGEAFDLPAWL